MDQREFRPSSYRCECAPGFHLPRPPPHFFSGLDVELAFLQLAANLSDDLATRDLHQELSRDLRCLPMPSLYSNATPTGISPAGGGLEGEGEDSLARAVPLGVQGFCVSVALAIGIAIICLRKTKVSQGNN